MRRPSRLHLLSDLHLEFSERHPPWSPPETDADIVILAGDIDNGTRAIDWAEQTFPRRTVLYVPGNHEYYETEIREANAALRQRSARSANVRVLLDDEFVIGGVRFLGTTLWTDFELFGRDRRADCIAESLKYVTDFRLVDYGPGRRLTPEDTIDFHREAIRFLGERLAVPFDGPTVVVTHHGPHPLSVHPRWAGTLSSGAFVSDLTPLLGQCRLWVHGHTHDGFDYTVKGTRVVANPMGYRQSNWRRAHDGSEPPRVSFENEQFDPGLVVDI